jgi:hypothetical protein
VGVAVGVGVELEVVLVLNFQFVLMLLLICQQKTRCHFDRSPERQRRRVEKPAFRSVALKLESIVEERRFSAASSPKNSRLQPPRRPTSSRAKHADPL